MRFLLSPIQNARKRTSAERAGFIDLTSSVSFSPPKDTERDVVILDAQAEQVSAPAITDEQPRAASRTAHKRCRDPPELSIVGVYNSRKDKVCAAVEKESSSVSVGAPQVLSIHTNNKGGLSWTVEYFLCKFFNRLVLSVVLHVSSLSGEWRPRFKGHHQTYDSCLTLKVRAGIRSGNLDRFCLAGRASIWKM